MKSLARNTKENPKVTTASLILFAIGLIDVVSNASAVFDWGDKTISKIALVGGVLSYAYSYFFGGSSK